MTTQLDHVFVCCSAGAPEAEGLQRIGLQEGTTNTHPGQGTACRRFFFENVYLELLWVRDMDEAQSELARPTGLWERWRDRQNHASPFGLVFRGSGDHDTAPFPVEAYRPAYLPEGVTIGVGRNTSLDEPACFYVAQTERAKRRTEPPDHTIAARMMTALRILGPRPGRSSEVATAVQALGFVQFEASDEYLMAMEFDNGAAAEAADLRPQLPLLLRW